ncbi:MAG: hypothetical protein WC851_01725 [Candidatus Shapirobacteria bacterium]|jgi:hypothetical protein
MNIKRDREFISKRNKISLFHRNFIVIFLTVISTIALIAIPNIPKEWIKNGDLLKISFLLLLVDIVIIPIYTQYRNNRDLDNLDKLISANRANKPETEIEKIVEKSHWNEYLSELVVFLYVVSIILIFLAIDPFSFSTLLENFVKFWKG